MSQMYLRAKRGGLRPLRLRPQGAKSRQRWTTEGFRHGSLPFVGKVRTLHVLKRANLNLFRLQSESIRPDGISHVAGRYEVNLRLIERSHAVGESLRLRPLNSKTRPSKPAFSIPHEVTLAAIVRF